MDLVSLWERLPFRENWLIPVCAGAGVSCVIFAISVVIARRRQARALDLLMIRGRDVPPTPVPRSSMDKLTDVELASAVLAYLNERPTDPSSSTRSAPDRRRELRRWGNPIEVWIEVPTTTAAVRGVVVNRSDGGVGIVVSTGYQPGLFLRIRAAQAPLDTEWISLEVRHCQAIGRKNWVIGCCYVGAPPWNSVAWLG